MLERLFHLEPGQLRRAAPFLLLYGLLFAALTLADGLAWALLVSRVGAAQLPLFQALAAGCVMLAIVGYFPAARRWGGSALFAGILLPPLLLFAGLGIGLAAGRLDDRALGLLFLGREVLFALVLLHFGAWLQEYFTREELARVMPVIYAGGRLGGIAGGFLLEHAGGFVSPHLLLLPLAGLLLLALLGVLLLARRTPRCPETDSTPRSGAAAASSAVTPRLLREPEELAHPLAATLRGFFPLLWRSPLLFYITLSTVFLFSCRAGLVLQCGLCFERHWEGEGELAAFLGRYTQLALLASLLFQLLLVGRLARRLGPVGGQFAYGVVVLLAAAALALAGDSLPAAAVAARFVEGELRYGWRNPLAQLTVNLFPRAFRTAARAWSLGFLIPAATLLASLGFAALLQWGAGPLLGVVSGLLAVGYLAALRGQAGCLAAPESSPAPSLPAPRAAA